MTVETVVVPAFIKVVDVARALGVSNECIYARVNTGRMAGYEVAASHTRGWSRTTLRTKHPDLWQVMLDYFNDQKAAA
jgi:hypothetical protein